MLQKLPSKNRKRGFIKARSFYLQIDATAVKAEVRQGVTLAKINKENATTGGGDQGGTDAASLVTLGQKQPILSGTAPSRETI